MTNLGTKWVRIDQTWCEKTKLKIKMTKIVRNDLGTK